MPLHWHPCGLLNGKPTHPYAIIVLNQPVNERALDAVIGSASLLVCADGGANRLYKCEHDNGHGHGHVAKLVNGSQTPSHVSHRLPDAIVGDLDSLEKEVEEYYRSCAVQVVRDPDQYSTDFTKCLKYIRKWATTHRQHSHGEDDTLDVVVLGGLGGRVDQGFSQIHHLFMAENDPSLLKGRIYLLSEQSLSFVLSSFSAASSSSTTSEARIDRNTNIIHLEPGYFAENVGILPVLGRTWLTTRGLEWDVENWPTQFGGQLSTSNHIRADKIEISFEGPRPLFTLELDKRLTTAGHLGFP
ncbi:thiamine pyrophosphokinase [Cladophialophora carrionii CBS 160.54]|uniref:Thiamine pyrophosphokinase n=1 Tax=Cladophialophora carrionii CBS 160.54 TaxID=1279043 RepID=V9D0B2_9EURO|nr:thiamine pyrophosphokinase [Cladophialophora carrionii CBS 160.54]ETI20096.1 thiamine pyrophosphokinase [Cladophialophora carrionii CBS 160.54]